jgi:hypothetical protein
VALAAIKGEQTLSALAEQFGVPANACGNSQAPMERRSYLQADSQKE